MNTYTVIGVWVGNQPYPIGTVAGRHEVEGGFHPDTMIEFEQGVWATSVDANDAAEAEELAVEEMLDDDDQEDVPTTLTVRHEGNQTYTRI